MLDLADALLTRFAEGRRVAVVTVTRVARSAPRGLGASMAVTDEGEVIGSISGGCVEGDSIVLARRVLAGGAARTARFGFDDATAFAAGLACGGLVDVIAYEVRADDPVATAALRSAAAGRRATIGIELTGENAGLVLSETADAGLAAAALLAETRIVDVPQPDVWPRQGVAGRGTAAPEDPADRRPVLAISHAPAPRLIVAGASDHAAALCRVGSAAGFAVTVVDAWELLVTAERFPEASELVVALPHEHLASLGQEEVDRRTAVCVLTHDTRLDVPALAQALRMPIGFVGALGARRTVARRADLLREAGVSDDELARLHSPLGLDLGGASPDETAVSVLAEIIAARHGGSGAPLRGLSGRVHRPSVSDAEPDPSGDAGSCAVPAPADRRPAPGSRSMAET